MNKVSYSWKQQVVLADYTCLTSSVMITSLDIVTSHSPCVPCCYYFLDFPWPHQTSAFLTASFPILALLAKLAFFCSVNKGFSDLHFRNPCAWQGFHLTQNERVLTPEIYKTPQFSPQDFSWWVTFSLNNVYFSLKLIKSVIQLQ